MPKSSVSDFELFALKVEKHIAVKVKKSEEGDIAYCLQKEEEALKETETWLRQKHAEWKLELSMREQQERKVIAGEIDRKWSVFKKEFEAAAKKALKKQLEKEFPSLVECFVVWASKHYKTGTFTLSEAYSVWVDRERFEVQISQEEKIIFRSDNLYIEYSVERMIEELKEEINAVMHDSSSKEDLWPV